MWFSQVLGGTLFWKVFSEFSLGDRKCRFRDIAILVFLPVTPHHMKSAARNIPNHVPRRLKTQLWRALFIFKFSTGIGTFFWKQMFRFHQIFHSSFTNRPHFDLLRGPSEKAICGGYQIWIRPHNCQTPLRYHTYRNSHPLPPWPPATPSCSSPSSSPLRSPPSLTLLSWPPTTHLHHPSYHRSAGRSPRPKQIFCFLVLTITIIMVMMMIIIITIDIN